MIRTREQRLAAKIFKQVQEVDRKFPTTDEDSKKQRTRYGGMCHKLPILIRTAGLAQALAFLHAKA
ncbi:MAG: type III-B CRISPR module-associated protein Cmr5, partial [Chloroflexaceae bacterium]|nr:type III-B CRISPR module-associated protein Cmr5 [Chloroflexaceae bacterium]